MYVRVRACKTEGEEAESKTEVGVGEKRQRKMTRSEKRESKCNDLFSQFHNSVVIEKGSHTHHSHTHSKI